MGYNVMKTMLKLHSQLRMDQGARTRTSRQLRSFLIAASFVSILAAGPPHKKPERQNRANTSARVGGESEARVIDPASKASFIPPAGWQRSDEAVAPNIIYTLPGAAPDAVNIGMVSAASGKQTLAQVIRSNKDFTTRTHTMTIYEGHRAVLAGQPAYAWRMHLKPTQGQPHEVYQIFCIHGGRSYVLTLTAQPAYLRRYEGLFDKVVASFKL